jgi:enamine deaminase RidA (YjgF/YER057c/UK114 family)
MACSAPEPTRAWKEQLLPSNIPPRHPDGDQALPITPKPQGRYLPAIVASGLVMTAGMTPRVDGRLQYPGKVGEAVSLAEAREAAGIALANAVAAIADVLGSTQHIDQVLRMVVYVNAAATFTEHSKVADGASDRLAELLGDRGSAVRTAVGVSSLPGGSCVEVELTCSRS